MRARRQTPVRRRARYKAFAKALATRMQTVLSRIISDTQQDFVHGRRMTKTAMMMAQQTNATDQDELTAENSTCLL